MPTPPPPSRFMLELRTDDVVADGEDDAIAEDVIGMDELWRFELDACWEVLGAAELLINADEDAAIVDDEVGALAACWELLRTAELLTGAEEDTVDEDAIIDD